MQLEENRTFWFGCRCVKEQLTNEQSIQGFIEEIYMNLIIDIIVNLSFWIITRWIETDVFVQICKLI